MRFSVTSLVQDAPFRESVGTECTFPSRRSHRVRLSVECAFPHLRKRGAVSRKSAFWVGGLTGKRILGVRPHGKAHSGAVRHLTKENRALAADHLSLNVPEADPCS